MLVAITGLVLSLMQAIFLYSKFNNQNLVQHEAMYQLESAANRITANLNHQSTKACVSQDAHPNAAINSLSQKGCSLPIEGKHVNFLINDLGSFPCVLITAEKEKAGSHHWLITVSEDFQTFLQIRYANIDPGSECNSESHRFINEGLLSWRLIRTSIPI
ncbi:hypothetical protein GCM10007966_06100 [Legionella impletisoli]|uniref:Uncharacterized protein n=2 Tax=Legionella impletisoli TaxID=343510 RepID=A0A917JQI4_9GAMM|nr:hypothetical protein GCM10007966_06100 [Legionella impletisoli]